MNDFSKFLLWERSSRDTIDVKKTYIDIAQDIVAGIVLSQIIYWHLPGKDEKTKLRVEKEGHLWIAKTRDDWWQECRTSIKQVDRALKALRGMGLIETRLWRFAGHPTTHIRIIEDMFLDAWEKALNTPPSGNTYRTREATKGSGNNRVSPYQGETNLPIREKPISLIGANESPSLGETRTKNTSQTTASNTHTLHTSDDRDVNDQTTLFSVPATEQEVAAWTQRLIALRVTPGRIPFLIENHLPQVAAAVPWWEANREYWNSRSKPGGAVAASITSPESYPQIYEKAEEPEPPRPKRPSKAERRAKLADAYNAVWNSLPDGLRESVEREYDDRDDYIEKHHANELAEAAKSLKSQPS